MAQDRPARHDFETVVRHLLSGDYVYPVRIVAFNSIEGWSRDATSEVADATAQRAIDADVEVSPSLDAFITANATKQSDVQLTLPLRGVAFGGPLPTQEEVR